MTCDEPVLTTAAMSEVDRAASEELGIPPLVLMEQAGARAWEVVQGRWPTAGSGGAPIVFVAGGGNNGGDALVMARHAVVGGVTSLVCLLVSERLRPLAATQCDILRRMGVEVRTWDHSRDSRLIASAALVVDGITGNGLTRPLDGDAQTIVEAINGSGAPVAAVDLPSGAREGAGGEDVIVRATLTIVTGFYRSLLFSGVVRPAAGEIVRVEPGFPRTLLRNRAGVPRVRLVAGEPEVPLNAPDAYKGTRGRVLVIGGGPGGYGAPVLVARAASAGGAGMVRLIAPDESGRSALCVDPGIQWGGAHDARGPASDEDYGWADAVVIGPGMTLLTVDDLAHAVDAAHREGCPVVVDAAGLRVLAGGGAAGGAALAGGGPPVGGRGGVVVLTPHPGEAAALAGLGIDDVMRDPLGVGVALARRYRAIVVMKGSVTHVIAADGEDAAIIDGREPALAVAGSGDVLAGVVATDLARRTQADDADRAFEATVRAVLRHLAAGRRAADRASGRAVTALMVAEALLP